MNILHITDIKKPNGNGVACAVRYYVKYEKNYSNVAIYNLNKDILVDGVNSFNLENYDSISKLPEPFNKPDIVVFNEVYKKKYLKLAHECLKNNIPYIIIPHGCLVKVAQKNRGIKKKIGNVILFNSFIKNSAAIQFLNYYECNDTDFKYKKSIVSGNGVDEFSESICEVPNRDLVYIGRYSIYHKGLDILIDMCKKNKDWFIENDVKIQLYGRSTRSDLDILKDLIDKNDVCDVVKLNDAIYDDEKINVLKKSYAFIQVSRHEGQPMGIVEALAYGVPCIVTKGTTFAEFINDNNCGVGVDFNIDDIFEAIKKMYSDKSIRNKFANNAIKSVKKYFYWDDIIKNLIKEYEKLTK